jgi:hypothetical protein
VKRQSAKPSAVIIVLLSAVAWLAISNHCALAVLRPAAETLAIHAHCHGNSPSPAKKSSDEELPCCKVLRATIAKDAANVQSPIKLAQPTHYPAAVETVSSHSLQRPGISNELDTGPPFVSSFAELILQRSLFAHAPPFFG